MFVIVSAIVSFPSPPVFAVSGSFGKNCALVYLTVTRVLAGWPAVETYFFSVSHSIFYWGSEILVYGERVTYISKAVSSCSKDIMNREFQCLAMYRQRTKSVTPQSPQAQEENKMCTSSQAQCTVPYST